MYNLLLVICHFISNFQFWNKYCTWYTNLYNQFLFLHKEHTSISYVFPFNTTIVHGIFNQYNHFFLTKKKGFYRFHTHPLCILFQTWVWIIIIYVLYNLYNLILPFSTKKELLLILYTFLVYCLSLNLHTIKFC